jgi:RNA polymerase sigma-70 factor (ECF subfamily)
MTPDSSQPPDATEVQPPPRAFVDALMVELPKMRGPAFMLARARADAYDLMQTTALRAISAHKTFQLGTNMRAWLYRIMRNEFIDLVRSRSHTVGGIDDLPDEFFARKATQDDSLQMRDVLRAFKMLPQAHREALYLRCAEGRSHEEIAEIQDCPIGTVKSRIARAREQVKVLLDAESFDE